MIFNKECCTTKAEIDKNIQKTKMFVGKYIIYVKAKGRSGQNSGILTKSQK